VTLAPLAYTLDGSADAPVLVLAGSLGTTIEMWQPQLPGLARQWRVLRFDHPGHGASPVPEGPVSVAAIGQGVVGLLDELGIARASFAGVSLGGAVGQWLAWHAPERVDRLVLCSTAARFASPERYRERARLVQEQGMRAVSTAVIDRWLTPGFRDRHGETVAWLRAMLESIPPRGYAACCEAVAGFDGTAGLARIAAPTLVLGGEDDPATTVEHAGELARGIAGAALRIIPDAAHLVSVERPEEVEEAMVEHLSGAENA